MKLCICLLSDQNNRIGGDFDVVSLNRSIACNQNIDETVSTVLSKIVADIRVRSKWKKVKFTFLFS